MKSTLVSRMGYAALLVTLAACSGSPSNLSSSQFVPSAAQTAEQSVARDAVQAAAPLSPPAGSIYLGARVSPLRTSNPQIVATFESQIGRKLAVDMHYSGWKETFPAADELDDVANGRIPVVSWNCGVSNAEIVSGSQDSLLDKRAAAIRNFGKPLMLRYMWEMNLGDTADNRTQCYDPKTDLPNGVFSPTEFIAAWAHIRSRFTADGVTNVVWLWNPSSGGQDALPYYPGSSEVDWVGADIYAFTDETFPAMFATMYSRLSPLAKPTLVAETGASSNAQSNFLTSVIPALKASYPLVKGFMYFDASGPLANWALSSSGEPAFAAMGHDPYFSAFEQ